VWAVGSADDRTLIEHWNGQAWSKVASPNPPNSAGSYLYGVSITSSNDAWAAGHYYNDAKISQPLLEHWNGRAWTIVATPSPTGSTHTQLWNVTARTPTDAWTAGWWSRGLQPPTWTGRSIDDRPLCGGTSPAYRIDHRRPAADRTLERSALDRR
jgi:hypothetical protein